MRWMVRVVMGLVVLGLLAIGALLFLPAEKIASLVENRFQAATGRTMTVQGDVRPTLWPSLGVTTGAVEIANADWSDAGPMLRAKGLSVSVDVMALLTGDIRITGISAVSPEILLEIADDGRGNWEVDGAAEPAAPSGESASARPLIIDKAEVRNGTVRMIDHRSGADHRLTKLDATFAVPSMVGSTSFDLSALMNGQALRAKGNIDGLAGFLEGGAVPVKANLEVGIAKAAFEGRAGLVPLAAAGRLTADLADLKPVMAALGQPTPDLPRGLGAQKLAVVGDVTFTPGTLNLRDAKVTLDSNLFIGAADVTFAERLAVNARLTTGALDLSGVSGGEAQPKPTAAATGWSKTPIDVSGLQAMDAKISLVASSIRFGATKLGATSLYTTLDNGRAVTEIKELRAYDGKIDGSVIINSRGGLSTRLILNGSALAISTLFAEVLDFDRVVASGDLSLNLLAVGNDRDTLMKSLSGEGRFSTGAGELLGLDLAGMLRTLDLGHMGIGSKTIFDRISASFTVDEGVLQNDDLKFQAPLLAASGAGTIGLGERVVNYRLEPHLLKDPNVRVPILITGPWAAPKIRLDLESLAREKLDAERSRTEKKAKAAALEKLGEALGMEVETGRQAEDAIKDKIEEEAKRGLLKLLGGD